MEANLTQEILTQVLSEPPEYLIGTIAGVITWIIMGCLLCKKKIFQTQKRNAEKYAQMGHRIEAELTNVTHHRLNGERYYRGNYRYTVEGKTYERSFSMDGPLPDKIYVYYDRNPKKAFIYNEIRGKYEYLLWFIIPLSVALLTALLFSFLLH